jgi:hypothetical protein
MPIQGQESAVSREPAKKLVESGGWSPSTIAAIQSCLEVAAVQPCPGNLLWVQHNNFRVPLLVDTGSSVTLLRYDTAKRLNLTIDPCTLTFGCAAGTKLNLKGSTEMEFSIEGKKLTHTCVVIDVDKVSFRGLLGLDFLKKYDGKCDFKTDTIHFPWASIKMEINPGDSDIQLLAIQEPLAEMQLLEPTTSNMSQISSIKNVNIPALCHIEITCQTTFAPNQEVFVDMAFLHQGLSIPPITTIVDEKGRILIMATNTESHPIHLKKGRLEDVHAVHLGQDFVLLLQQQEEQEDTAHTAPLTTSQATCNSEEINFCDEDNEEPDFCPEPLSKEMTLEERLAMFNFADIRPEHLGPLKNLIIKYIDVFAFPDRPLGCAKNFKHVIDTGEAEPVNIRPYRVPHQLRPKMKEALDNMLEQDIIEPAYNSAWSAPMIMVARRAPDGTVIKYRPCIDWRGLNKVTKRRVFYLPLAQDILDSMADCKYISTLDLDSGYWQFLMDEESKEKTAFSTPYGQFQCKRMGFGLINAPTDFSGEMMTISRKMKRKGLKHYMDDFFAGTPTFEEHLPLLEETFSLMREENLQFKPSKCCFMSKKVNILGHTVSDGKVTPDMAKVEAIGKMQPPRTVKEIRSWLGMANFYRRYIRDYAKTTSCLCELTKDKEPYLWTDDRHLAFTSINNALLSEPVLRLPQEGRLFILSTDASNVGIGAVLEQEFEDGHHPIAFFSKKLTDTERRYSTTDRELLAAYRGVIHFDAYLRCVRFKLKFDHAALKWMLTSPTRLDLRNTRQARAIMALLDYDMIVEAIPGTQNGPADAMSRLLCATVQENLTPETTGKRADKISQLLNKNEETKIWNRENIKLAQQEDTYCSTIIKLLTSMQKPKEAGYFIDKAGLLFLQDAGGGRLVVPAAMVPRVLKANHDLPCGGHKGAYRMLHQVRNRFFWPGMAKQIKNYTASCQSCIRVKGRPLQLGKPREPPPIVVRLQRLSIDIVGPKSVTARGNRFIFTMIDDFSNYLDAVALPDTKTTTIAWHLIDRIIARFGTPKEIHSDRGVQFTSKLFHEVCKLMRIKQIFTAPYHPQGNGKIERAHRTANEFLVHFCCNGQSDWDLMLPFALMAHNSSPNRTNGMTPATLMLSRDIIMPWEDLPYPETDIDLEEGFTAQSFTDQLQARLALANAAAIEHSGEQHADHYSADPLPSFAVGDIVYLRELRPQHSAKEQGRWRGPFLITRRRSDVTYDIRAINPKANDRTKLEMTAHACHLRPAGRLADMLIDSFAQGPEANVPAHNIQSAAPAGATRQSARLRGEVAPELELPRTTRKKRN